MKKFLKKFGVIIFSSLLVLGIATTAIAGTAGPTVPSDGEYMGSPNYAPAPPLDGDNQDNSVGNANQTGKNVGTDTGATVNDVIKSRDMVKTDGTGGIGTNQRTHGEYQNNTNSCASCHQTHTGATKDLLFKSGVFYTCTACHDGTLGFYNVFGKGAGVMGASTAGTFGGTATGNASIHLADGSQQIAMAPGGKYQALGTFPNKDTREKEWIAEFDCAACHAPHGSYSDRLLHYNPNNMANLYAADGGQKVTGAVVDVLPTVTSTSPTVVVWRTTKGALAGLKTVQDWTNGNAQAGLENEAATEPIIIVMKKGPLDANSDLVQDKVANVAQNTYLRDLTPWLYGYDFDPYPTKKYYTTLRYADAKAIEKNVDYEYGFAYVKGQDVATAATMDVGQAYVVKLAGEVVRKDAAGVPFVTSVGFNQVATFGGIAITAINPDIYDEASKGMDGYGVRIGKYCGACHTDYRAKSVDYVHISAGGMGQGTGIFTKAFRHTTNNDRYTCLKCHYAHGTDVTVMLDSQDNNIATLVSDEGFSTDQAISYLTDKNASSALKRYTNMAVCWKCHTDSKATQLKNNSYFWNNYDTVPHGGSSGKITSSQYGW